MGILKFIGRHIIEIAIVVLAVFAGAYFSSSLNNITNFFFPDRAVVQTSRTIVTSLQGIGKLVTVEAEVVKTDVRVSIHGGFLNAGYYSANHVAVGVIDAGIDFSKIDDDSVRFENDSYTITLPFPVITSCRIEHIDQNKHSFTLLSANWDIVRQLAQYEAIEQFAQDMIEADILDRAKEEANLQIGSFASNLSAGKPVNIVYEEQSSEVELPRSCQPDPPSGWGKDEESEWRRN